MFMLNVYVTKYLVIKSSEVKTIKVCNRRQIGKFAKGTGVFMNLSSVIKL